MAAKWIENCNCDLKSNYFRTLSSAIETILSVTSQHAGPNPVYIGGSLGGYIGMELLGQHPNVFKSAVILMCGIYKSKD